MNNLEKCLLAGFQKVICVLPNKKQLTSAQDAAKERLTGEQLQKVIFAVFADFVPKNGKYENPERFLQ